MFERFTWELRATLLGNYARNARDARDAPDVGIHVNRPPHAHPASPHEHSTPPHPLAPERTKNPGLVTYLQDSRFQV